MGSVKGLLGVTLHFIRQRLNVAQEKEARAAFGMVGDCLVGEVCKDISRWNSMPLGQRPAGLETLDKVLRTSWFVGREGKKKCCDVVRLLGGRVDAFVRVWAEVLT